MKEHKYGISLQWTGNNGRGTANYRAYNRSYEIKVPGKPLIFGSSDPTFRGDQTKYNPEELLIASLSSCHMLWYLHLCADAGIIVTKLEMKALSISIVNSIQLSDNVAYEISSDRELLKAYIGFRTKKLAKA